MASVCFGGMTNLSIRAAALHDNEHWTQARGQAGGYAGVCSVGCSKGAAMRTSRLSGMVRRFRVFSINDLFGMDKPCRGMKKNIQNR